MPFGARGPDRATGVLARQLARRLVERLAGEVALELKPVFLVSVPERSTEEGYVVIGSAPDPELAAGYGASLGCSHALVGTLVAAPQRALELSLVEVGGRSLVRAGTVPIPSGELHLLEPALAAWLGEALGVGLADGGRPPAAGEPAYAALLGGMEEELNAVLLATGSAEAARAATVGALEHYAACLRADPSCAPAEERLLVMGAESLGSGLESEHARALESLTEALPSSWKAHFLLGELRRATGDLSGAVVALEHSDALHPLVPEDAIRLAELYLDAGAGSSAAARLRRVRRSLAADAPAGTRLLLAHALIRAGRREDALAELEHVVAGEGPGASAARAHRLRLGLTHPDLERELEEAGRLALEAPAGSLETAAAGFERVLAADPALWEAVFGLGLVARRRGDPAGAERAFRRALVAAGRLALEAPAGSLETAAAGFERVLAADPALWEAVFGLGLVARRRGDPAGAERAFRQALELWPGHPDATHELGVALLMSGSFDDAGRALEEAARARPDDAGYLADAGFAQLRAGRLPAARERLERAAAIEPADPITRAYLAELRRVEAEIGRDT